MLHHASIILETVPYTVCLKSFVEFLKATSKLGSGKIILIGHNSSTFDTPILLRTFLQYVPELIQEMKEMNVHFADSLALFHHLVKGKHDVLKADDGSFVKINQAALYQLLFGTVFNSHGALKDVIFSCHNCFRNCK